MLLSQESQGPLLGSHMESSLVIPKSMWDVMAQMGWGILGWMGVMCSHQEQPCLGTTRGPEGLILLFPRKSGMTQSLG